MPNVSIPVRPLFFNAMTAPSEPPDETWDGGASPALKVWRRAAPFLLAYAALQIVLRLAQLPPGAPRVVIVIAGILVSVAVIVLSSAALFALVTPPSGWALATVIGLSAFL